MYKRGQASLEYIMMFAMGMLIAAVVILHLIGVKGLAKWVGSQMDRTGTKIGNGFNNLTNVTGK